MKGHGLVKVNYTIKAHLGNQLPRVIGKGHQVFDHLDWKTDVKYARRVTKGALAEIVSTAIDIADGIEGAVVSCLATTDDGVPIALLHTVVPTARG